MSKQYRVRARFMLWLEKRGYEFKPIEGSKMRRILRLAYRHPTFMNERWAYGFEKECVCLYRDHLAVKWFSNYQLARLFHYVKFLWIPAASVRLHRYYKIMGVYPK